MVGVYIRAIIVALLVVAEHHLVFSGVVTHCNTGIAYRILITDIESHCGILAHHAILCKDHLQRGDHHLGLAACIEYQAGGMLARCRKKFGSIHHETATIVNVGQYVIDYKVTFVTTETRIAVFLRLHLCAQHILHPTQNGIAEIMRIHQTHAVGAELWKLGLGLVLAKLSIAGFGSKARTRPVDAATLALPQILFVVVYTRGTIDYILVLG